MLKTDRNFCPFLCFYNLHYAICSIYSKITIYGIKFIKNIVKIHKKRVAKKGGLCYYYYVLLDSVGDYTLYAKLS